MKILKKVLCTALCAALVVLTLPFSAFASEPKSVTIKSKQNFFEPFSRTINPNGVFDVTIKLSSGLPVVDGTTVLGFDSSKLRVKDVRNGIIKSSQSNITEKRQTDENSVITVFSAGSGFYDFSSENRLLSYTFKASGSFDSDTEIEIDFQNLTANRTHEKDDGTEDITVNGDVRLISKGEAVSEGFSVGAIFEMQKGDIDLNGIVNISDASELQLALVGRVALTDEQKLLAQTYRDDKISIRDVTMIQLFLAGLVENL
ncbi:MAG: hypothetical protein K6F88_03625 [Ruminococcus sp.]|nr:hypothetical protein [Ruminococcus sp.]